MFSQIINKVIDTSVSYDSRNLDRILLFEEIYQNLEMGYSIDNLEYTTFCLMYFLASLKYLVQYREVKKPKELDVIQKSILFMKDNLENKITLDDIAHSVGYSSSHFSNYFTQKTNFPPYDYYNQLKIQKACSYLQFSDLKIKEIAYKLGYFDQFHFSKSFKKEMEMSPKDYRKKYNP
jgi:AraC-like DNA-binding protein